MRGKEAPPAEPQVAAEPAPEQQSFKRRHWKGLTATGLALTVFAGGYAVEQDAVPPLQPLAEMPLPKDFAKPGLICHASAPCDETHPENTLKILGNTTREWVDLELLPDYVGQTLVAAEDQRFYTHKGVDKERIPGMVLGWLRCACIDSGGSTLTDTIAQNAFQAPARTRLDEFVSQNKGLIQDIATRAGGFINSIVNKAEAVDEKVYWQRVGITYEDALTRKYTPEVEAKYPPVAPLVVEPGATPDPAAQEAYDQQVAQRQALVDADVQDMVKDDVLELGINVFNFGRNDSIGLNAAAHSYFNKSAAELTEIEVATLVSMLVNPSDTQVNVFESDKTLEIGQFYTSFITQHGLAEPTVADDDGKISPYLLAYGESSEESIVDVYNKVQETAAELTVEGELTPEQVTEGKITAEQQKQIYKYGWFIRQHDWLVFRRNNVVNELEKQGIKTPGEAAAMRATPLVLAPFEIPDTTSSEGVNSLQANHYLVRAQNELDELGFTQQRIRDESLRVQLTLRPEYQQAVNNAIASEQALLESPTDDISVDIMLENGAVLAYRSGKNETASQVDYVTSKFNSGSTIKPEIWAMAFENGWNLDTQVQVQNPDGTLLPIPLPAENGFPGITVDEGQHAPVHGDPPSTTPGEALAASDNIATAQAANQAGGMGPVFEFINTAAGLEVVRKDWAPNNFYGIELSNETQATVAINVLANKGQGVVKPYFVESVSRPGPGGEILYQHPDVRGGAFMNPGNAAAVAHAMKGAFKPGGTAEGRFTPPNGPDSTAYKTGTDGSTEGTSESTRLSGKGVWCQEGVGAVAISLTVGEPDNNTTPITAFSSSGELARVAGKIIGPLQSGQPCDIAAFAMP